MTTRYQNIFKTVSSGDTLTGSIEVSNLNLRGLWAPVVDSCEIRLLGSFDSSSANFVRMDDTNIDPGASGYTNEFLWLIGPGSKGLLLHDQFDGMPFIKLETSVSQTDNRTLTLMMSF